MRDHLNVLPHGLPVPLDDGLFFKDGIIQKVFYLVFPPDKNAEVVLAWLKTRNA